MNTPSNRLLHMTSTQTLIPALLSRARCVGRRSAPWCAGALLAALALAGCGTTASARYYTLLDAAGGRAAPAAAPGRYALQVQPVSLPPAVDVPQLLVRSSAGEVVPLENARWLGPLADEIRGALVSQLTQALGVPEVSSVAVPPGLPVYRLQLGLTRFDSVAGRYALQDADWSLREVSATGAAPAEGTAGGGEPAVLLCRSRQVVAPADGSTEALVNAHQRALDALGGQIAAVAALPPAQWRCP
ncbi:MAG: PqiC family protein [Comamonas sp.]